MHSTALAALAALAILVAAPALAYEPAHLDQLLATNACVECDLRAAPLGGVDLSGAVLDLADLTRATLTGAQLDDASAIHTTFDMSDAVGASFARIDAEGASFRSAELDDTVFLEARLRRVRFDGAIGQQANFQGADLRNASFLQSDFMGAQFRQANLDRASALRADFRAASFTRGTMIGASFVQCVLDDATLYSVARYVDLSGASLVNTDLSETELHRARFDDAYLHATDLRGAKLHHVDLSVSDFEDPLLAGADFSYADLSGMDLEDYDLRGVILRETQVVGTQLAGADLSVAQILQTNLAGLDLHGASLESATIVDSGFQATNLHGANLRFVDWNSAGTQLHHVGDLRYADLTGFVCTGCTFPQLVGLILDRATLHGCNFDGLWTPSGTGGEPSFYQADLTGCSMQDTTLVFNIDEQLYIDMREANLSGVVADGSFWHGINATDATLVGLSCVGCRFQGTLHGADLTGADLRESDSVSDKTWDWTEITAVGLDLRGASHQRIDLRGADLGGALLTDLQTESLSFAASDLTGATGLNSIAGIDEPATIGYCATTLPDGQSFTSWPFGSGWGGCDEGKRSRLVRTRR